LNVADVVFVVILVTLVGVGWIQFVVVWGPDRVVHFLIITVTAEWSKYFVTCQQWIDSACLHVPNILFLSKGKR
jgi:hypothetical protein